MALTGSLGTGLQGVSQQQPRVRLRGQVTEQSNMQSDVVRGLTTRPPAKEIAVFDGEVTDLKFDDVEIDGVKYTVGFRDGVIKVWDSTGTSFAVTTQDSDAVAYIGDNMSFHVYDKTIYVSNQDVTVLEDSTIDTTGVMLNQGIIQSLGGRLGQNLTTTVHYDDGTTATTFHNIGDDNSSNANADVIMIDVHGDLTGSKKASTTLTLDGNVLLITDDTFTFTITVNDNSDGELLRQHVNLADKIEDLARLAPHGTLVKVEGEDKSDDDFYMRFEIEGISTVGDGFGLNGIWREWVNVREPVSLDFKTLPHVLFKIGNTFFFERNLWQSRRTGDALSNPHPTFLGEKITDLGGFQSRLTFTAGANWIAGRTNLPADFYKKSVVTELDSDPIDIASTTESEVELKWMVPFDRDLLLMSEKHQFIVAGGTALTPDNSSMVLTTDFEMAGKARPSSTGRTILFPYTIGQNAGVKEFFSSDEIATNGADNISETVSTYIKGDIVQLATSTNFNTTLIRTDDAASASTVWVYKYLWEGVAKKQSSWSKWVFPYPVSYVYWDNATVHIIMRDGTDYILMTVEMDYPAHDVGYIPTLDRQTDEVASGTSTVTLEYEDAEFVQHTGCAAPGTRATEVSVSGAGPFVYTFNTNTVPSGATVVAGLPYVGSVQPTMPFMRDRSGEVVGNGTLVVTEFEIFFRDSGGIDSLRTSKFRIDRSFDNQTIITANDPEDPDAIGIRSGEWNIPWGERSDWAELTLTSMNLRPMTIMQIEWTGQAFTRGTLA